jgi:hypothetical protein
MAVSYEKKMRERAIQDRKGLYTLEILGPSIRPGKFNGKICMQGPANKEDYKAIYDFMIKLMERRAEREAK